MTTYDNPATVTMHTVELTDGTEYACNQRREGVFSRRADGSWLQHIGTGQTPRFTSARHMMAWVRRHLSSKRDDGSFPAIKRGTASGWSEGA